MGKIKEFVLEVFDYLDGFVFVNESEVSIAVQEFLMENDSLELSFEDNLFAGDLAEQYIKERGLKFEPDLVITLDHKGKCIHLSDLNNQYNDKQVKKMEARYQVVFEEAVDCLEHGYTIEACNFGSLDEEAKQKVWAAAKMYVGVY